MICLLSLFLLVWKLMSFSYREFSKIISLMISASSLFLFSVTITISDIRLPSLVLYLKNFFPCPTFNYFVLCYIYQLHLPTFSNWVFTFCCHILNVQVFFFQNVSFYNILFLFMNARSFLTHWKIYYWSFFEVYL